MSDAGHEPALPIGRVETGDHELDQIAEAYLSQAEGDVRAALLQAIADDAPYRPLSRWALLVGASLRAGAQRGGSTGEAWPVVRVACPITPS
jgi:hypothetical protein